MSILVDTNVLSELMRPGPHAAVRTWFARQAADSLFVSVITQAEMFFGVALLPLGKRRATLEAALQATFKQDFARRVLPFDSAAVPALVEITVSRRRAGRPIQQPDAQIAAIARSRGLRVATRNVADFEGCGVELIDPWKAVPH